MRRWLAIGVPAVLLGAAIAGTGAVADTTTGPVISACIHSGSFTRVTTASPRPCASGDNAVQWQGLPAPSPTSPSPTPTSPSPTPTTPSPTPTTPSPSPTGNQCVLTSFNGACGPYDYAPDTSSSGYNTYVDPDFFNSISGETTTLTVTDPGHWDDLATAAAGNTSVTGYPSNSQGSSGNGTNPLLSSYTTLTSTFAENMNANPGTDAEAAYDVWTAAGDETMIQFDFSPLRTNCQQAGLPILATVAVAEPGTGTVQNWNFCEYGTERIWQLDHNEQSGSVDLGALLGWEQANGYLPADAALSLTGFGFEICSTGGQAEDFQVSQYSLTAIHS